MGRKLAGCDQCVLDALPDRLTAALRRHQHTHNRSEALVPRGFRHRLLPSRLTLVMTGSDAQPNAGHFRPQGGLEPRSGRRYCSVKAHDLPSQIHTVGHRVDTLLH
jgi:hypothetical protein